MKGQEKSKIYPTALIMSKLFVVRIAYTTRSGSKACIVPFMTGTRKRLITAVERRKNEMLTFKKIEIDEIRSLVDAHKGKLCNLRMWDDAEFYQTILDKLDDISMIWSVVHCKDCMHWSKANHECRFHDDGRKWEADGYCSFAVRSYMV